MSVASSRRNVTGTSRRQRPRRAAAAARRRSGDASVLGVRRMFDQLAADGRLSATAMQTVGSKGYDGFALALVTSDP